MGSSPPSTIRLVPERYWTAAANVPIRSAGQVGEASCSLMTRWHSLEPVDTPFFVSAPHIFRYERRFAASPERVWESITSDASASAWGRMIKEVAWTSPPPHGVGATRESVALGARARSRYFRWD